ncbi:MAG TPA: hydroxymethylbilane synthase [Candidatus Sulfotelmatobacter sp.]
MTATTLRIGSRGSQLALWQANHIAALLRAHGHTVEIEIIRTTGDKITDVALAKVGTKGMFTKEIEEALAAGQVDLAVHSLKDLPTDLPPGFELAAIPQRQDARDAFCSRHFEKIDDLPNAACVGTSSLRRQAQLKAIRPDLNVHPLRGNVDTRLRKLEEGEYDAIILAAAGLKRLGKMELVKQILPAEVMCPAAGQGALAIEIRAGDEAMRAALTFLEDPAARAATTCERALLNRLGGGCQVPIGAYASLSARELTQTESVREEYDPIRTVRDRKGHELIQTGRDREGHEFTRAAKIDPKIGALAPGVTLHLEAIVADPDGSQLLRESRDGTDPEAVGIQTAEALLTLGADEILDAVYGRGLSMPPQP